MSLTRATATCTGTLPFAHFHAPVPCDPSPAVLHDIYMSLYSRAVAGTRPDARAPRGIERSGPAAISYNLALATTSMLLCPRRSESAYVELEGRQLGPVNVNGTVLGASLMVKTADEWHALRQDSGKRLHAVLARIGFPPARPDGLSVEKL